MSERKMTLPEWHHFLNEKLTDAPKGSIRMMSLEALPRLMFILDNHRHLCSGCAQHYDRLLSMILELPEWLKHNTPEVELFRKELHATTQFLATQHGLYPKGLWLSRITSYGIITGVLAGFVSHALIENPDLPGLLILGATAGMMVGWILGKIKEHQLKKDGKLF